MARFNRINWFNLHPLLNESCEQLSGAFYKLKSSHDICNLLKVPYSYLIYYIYRMSPTQRYNQFKILKRRGGYRNIHAPCKSLKIVQRKLSQVLYAVYEAKFCVHGFAPSRSIITNAKAHVGKRFILNLDIKDFFSSINFGRVRGLFMAKPYELNPEVATILAQIACFENQLPQGSPCSPIISNLICAKMDSELLRFSKLHKLFYTRYADDLTFSSDRKEVPSALVSSCESGISVSDELRVIIENNGFKINETKVRLADKKQRQEVTGLIVNKKVNVSRKYIRNVRATLHNWEKNGLESVTKTYFDKYVKKTTLPDKESARFLDSLKGKIEFIGSVRGKNDHLYKQLIRKFFDLRQSTKVQ